MVPLDFKTTSFSAWLTCFILPQAFVLKAHISHSNFASHDHSMTPTCKVPSFASTKYQQPLYGGTQLITEVLLGCLPNLCKTFFQTCTV